MRLLASGDNHFAEHLRFDECIDIHNWMVVQARALAIDVFLDAGDLFDGASTPIERQAVADWLTAMAEVCPVVIAKGNHDRPRDVALMRRLQTKHPVIVEEAAGVHYVAGAAIATMAWPDRSSLLASLDGLTPVDAQMRSALRAVLVHMGMRLEDHAGPRILLGHFMVDGSVTSTGQPLLGMPINVGLSDLALARAHLTVMGHIHKAQRFDLPTGAPAFYTGSPFRTDFGQLEPKSVLYAEFDGERLVRTEEIETPCAPMLHIEETYDPEEAADRLDDLEERAVRGAEVRLRYQVPADQRDAGRAFAAAAAHLLGANGAKSVKVEEVVIATRRARAPEVARAATIQEKLAHHWASVGFEPDEQTREQLFTRAVRLEEEATQCA
jgi:DNA repair exonuclease SbcCD nuclease subunit